MKELIHKSIFLKTGVFVLTTLFILLLCLFAYLQIDLNKTRNLTKSITAELTSKSVLDKIDRNFYERFGDVQAFAYNHLAKTSADSGKPHAQLLPFMNTMTTYYVLYDLMMLCDAHGKVIATNTIDKTGKSIDTRFLAGADFSKEEWFKICTSATGPEGGAWYSRFSTSNIVSKIYNTPGWGMGFAAPVKNDKGKVVGVWYNFASWEEITRGIRKEAEAELAKTEPGSLVILTRKEGEIIDANDPLLIASGNVLSEENFEKQDQHLTINDQKLPVSDYVYYWATAKGAYTYKGRNWRAVTMVPKAHISLGTIFNAKMLTIYATMMLVVGGMGYLIFQFFNNNVVKNIREINRLLTRIAMGEIVSINPKLVSGNEIGSIAWALEKVTRNIKKTSEFAGKIGKNEFDETFQPQSDNDVLGIALFGMQNNLLKVKKEEEQRNWTATGLAKFSEILQKNSEDKNSMADQLLSQLIKYVGANQGMLYVMEPGSEDAPVLKALSCYAWDRKKFVNKEFQLGEGLAGQACLERELIYVSEVPDNYIQITSGLGGSIPKNILVIPLVYEKEAMGALELAFFEPLPSFKQEFLVKVSETIASALRNHQINERTGKLLNESQILTEQLKAQEEEMRQNIEELTATQEEASRKQLTDSQYIHHLQQVINKIPFPVYVKDSGDQLTLVNDAFAHSQNFQAYQITGMKENEMIRDNTLLELLKKADMTALEENNLETVELQQPGKNTTTRYSRIPVPSVEGDEKWILSISYTTEVLVSV